MLYLYAFRDVKSGVLSNHFITAEPWEKIKQNISISLLQLSIKDKTNPFILYAKDYDLVVVGTVKDEIKALSVDATFVNCSDLLAASRQAFNAGQGHTSPTEVSDNDLE